MYKVYNLNDMKYDTKRKVLDFCLRKSDKLIVTHMMKEAEFEGERLYDVCKENIKVQAEETWRELARYAFDNSHDFFLQYEISEESKWVEEKFAKLEGCILEDIEEVDGRKIRSLRRKLKDDYKAFAEDIILNDALGFEKFDWDIQLIDNNMNRILFLKHNSREVIDGIDFKGLELTEGEIDKFNENGFIIQDVVEYKHRFPLKREINDKVIEFVLNESDLVQQGEVCNLRDVRLYHDNREILASDFEFHFKVCLLEEEIEELIKMGLDTNQWKVLRSIDEYRGSEDYISNRWRGKLRFDKIELDTDSIKEAAEKMLGCFKIN